MGASVQDTNTSIEDAADTDTHTVSLPSNISSGNLLIVNFAVDSENFDPVVSWPSGWTEIHDRFNNEVHLSVAYRQADGTEGSTITVETVAEERSAHTSYRITGHEDPAIQEPEVSTGANARSANPDPDSLTPTGGSKDYLWIAVQCNDTPNTTDAFPTNYSNGISVQGSDPDSVSIGSAERELTASVEDPEVFTISTSDRWEAATIAVHPGPVVSMVLPPPHRRQPLIRM